MYTFVSKAASPTTDTTLPLLRRDKLLDGDGGGVKALVDLAFTWCNPGGNPANNAAIKDISEIADHSVVLAGADVVAGLGGGFDFTNALTANTMLRFAANAAAAIWADANQYFLFCMYIKLPLLADWNVAGGSRPMATFANGFPATNPDLMTVSQSRIPATTGAPYLTFDRQYATNTVETLSLAVNASDPGGFAQIALWRNASGTTARLKTPNGIVTSASSAHNVASTVNFSALQGGIGTKGAATVNGYQKFRLYRAFIESLTTSGRDPATVLDADYARTIARGVYS